MGIEKWDLVLAKKIINNHQSNTFKSFVTVAERGYGKSVYNLKSVAKAAYELFGLDEEEAWKYAFDCMIFQPEQFIKKVEYNMMHDKVDMAWILDDAAVHFNKYLFFANVHLASAVMSVFDTIRVVVNNLLINTATTNHLFSALNDYDDVRIQLYKIPGNNNYRRKAVAINFFSLPDGKQKYRKIFEDHFSCYAPNWFYKEIYMPVRKRYLKESLKKMKELREKLEKKKKSKEEGEI
ncbi:MAG TPA: hypothetical protein ENG24_03335 [Thermoplasmatales archaeon]|nr:hypothetical protein [Thermoplasmatales archaeon]